MKDELHNHDFIESLLLDIFNGDITPTDLSKPQYMAIAKKLKSGLYEGFGGTLTAFEGPPLELLVELRSNIYMFSAAKTFNQTLEMSESLTDGDRILTWPEFKQKAADIYAKHNGGDYLQGKKEAAYDHATDAYNHATDGINRANAAQRSADSAYSLANTANNNAAAANNNALS